MERVALSAPPRTLATKPAKKSVASELISALTKTKAKDAAANNVKKEVKIETMDEFAKLIFGKEAAKAAGTPKAAPAKPLTTAKPAAPPLKKKPVNDDWINFLKKKQDVEPNSDEIEVVKVEPKKAKTDTVKPSSPNTAENHAEKDKVLKNLLSQVSDLETTMGSSISKLEAQLRTEQEKNLKLKIKLDNEQENAAKLMESVAKAEKGKSLAEDAMKAINKELKEEKGVNIELFDKTINLEQENKENKTKLDKVNKELKAKAVENEALATKVTNFSKWKAECAIKVKAARSDCQKEHVEKIEDLVNKVDELEDILTELSRKIPAMVAEHNNKTSGLKTKDETKSKEIKQLKKKVSNLETALHEKETMIKADKEAKANEEIKELQEEVEQENTDKTTRKLSGKKRKCEDVTVDEPNKKKVNLNEDDLDEDAIQVVVEVDTVHADSFRSLARDGGSELQ